MGLMAVLAHDGQREGQGWAQGELLPPSGCVELWLPPAHVPNRLPSIPRPSRISYLRLLPPELERNQILFSGYRVNPGIVGAHRPHGGDGCFPCVLWRHTGFFFTHDRE